MRCSFSVANGYSDELFATSAQVYARLSGVAITNKIIYTFVNGNLQQCLGLWGPVCISCCHTILNQKGAQLSSLLTFTCG